MKQKNSPVDLNNTGQRTVATDAIHMKNSSSSVIFFLLNLFKLTLKKSLQREIHCLSHEAQRPSLEVCVRSVTLYACVCAQSMKGVCAVSVYFKWRQNILMCASLSLSCSPFLLFCGLASVLPYSAASRAFWHSTNSSNNTGPAEREQCQREGLCMYGFQCV